MDPASTDKVVRANFFKVDKHAIPAKIFQYHVHLYRINKDGTVSEEDVAAFEDHRTTHALMNELLVQGEKTEDLEVRDLILSWPQCTRQSMTYDGASCLFTTSPLAMKETVNKKGDKISQISIVLTLPASMGGINNNQYKMSFTKTAVITAGEGCVTDCQAETLRALDTALLSFGRVQQTRDMPDWVVAGTKAFRFNTGADGRDQLNLTGAYEALRGYTASLKSTVAGLCLVSDMNVSSFLSAGELTHVMALAAGFRSIESFYQECRRGLNSKTVSMINDVLKGAKIKVTYNNQWRKFKKLGPPANSRDSVFEVYENEKVPKKVTVAEYFSEKSRGDDELGKAFRKFMEKNELRYPSLPTVDIGSQKRPVLIPAEMIVVPGGQIRSKKLSAEITASIIKYAAVKPAERFHFLSSDIGGGGNFVNILKNDPTASAYGMHGLETEPMKCSARLLPPPNIQYANCVETPGFAGTWNLEGKKFVQPPVSEMGDNKFKYGILGVGRPPHKWEDSVDSFMGSLVGDARTLGVQLIAGGPHLACGDAPHNIGEAIGKMKEGGAHIVFVVLFFDVYRIVKLQGDSLGMITQCLKWKNVMKPPRGYCSNVMLKVNAKLGGLNHVLTDRRDNKAPMASWGTSPSGAASEPPSSISWLFEKPCMIMGVNVSLSDPIKKDASLTTVIVASMDRACAKYVAHVQSSKSADTNQLSRAAEAVTTGFKNRNGTVPETVIIYRDGVSDGEFSKVVDVELEQIKDGLVAAGCVPDVKITVIICQKGHHTRLVYEEPDASASGGSSTFVNPAPGLVVDASDHESTIVSARYNEFYLNSHAAIQGTAKPCRYSLIYDSVGLKMSEIELLSYWTCYLYARCNKSVSYATPAYYAHLAARRAKDYTSIGATRQDLENISDHFCGSGKSNEVPRSGMYFV
jgi:eukaryotic translation initiation factor 2C